MPEAAPVTSAVLPERSALIIGVSLQKGRQLEDSMPPSLRLSSRPRLCYPFAHPEMYELTQAEHPPKIGRHYHIAFKAESDTYEELKQRLDRAGEKYRETNHGYCKSIYVNSPDGLIVEFTQDPEDVAEIDAVRRADAHSELA